MSVRSAATHGNAPQVRFRYIAIAVGALLIVTSFAKLFGVFSDGRPPAVWDSSAQIALAVVELLMAFWLFSGLMPRRLWMVAILQFAIFASVSGYELIAGQESCGCFGQAIQTSPGITLLLDLVILLALARYRPTSAKRQHAKPGNSIAALAVGAGIALLVMAGATAQRPPPSAHVHNLWNWGILVGKRFPLMDHVKNGSDLENGRWIILVLSPGCAACELVRREYAAYTPEQLLLRYGARLMVVETRSPTDGNNYQVAGGIVRRLKNPDEWDIATPSVLELKNGIVMAVKK